MPVVDHAQELIMFEDAPNVIQILSIRWRRWNALLNNKI
jgi:hypothetical protein